MVLYTKLHYRIRSEWASTWWAFLFKLILSHLSFPFYRTIIQFIPGISRESSWLSSAGLSVKADTHSLPNHFSFRDFWQWHHVAPRWLSRTQSECSELPDGILHPRSQFQRGTRGRHGRSFSNQVLASESRWWANDHFPRAFNQLGRAPCVAIHSHTHEQSAPHHDWWIVCK